MKLYRQGDVLLKRVRTIPKEAAPQERNGPVVLALGETTGHKHQIVDDDVAVFVKSDGTMYLRIQDAVALQHEEHATIVL